MSTISLEEYKRLYGLGLTPGIPITAVIAHRASYYANLYNIMGVPLPLEEFLSRGWELYAEALGTYDADKGASLQTYLWHRLGRLKDVAVSEQRRILRSIPFDGLEQKLRSGMEALAAEDLCLDDLSADALALVRHLIERGMRKGLRPSARTVAARIGWDVDRTEDAWEEVGVWVAHGGRPVFRAEFTCV